MASNVAIIFCLRNSLVSLPYIFLYTVRTGILFVLTTQHTVQKLQNIFVSQEKAIPYKKHEYLPVMLAVSQRLIR